MKIICDCGKEFLFKEDDWEDEYGSIHVQIDGMTICGERDEVWITCDSCGKSIHLFT